MKPAPWRTGRKLGRTLYERKYTDGPSDEDRFLGIMDSPDDAERVVEAVNANHGPTPEVQRARAAILAEIDDMDPDGHMRHLMEDQTREGGDPGHPGNAWWRAYCHVGGLMVALACLEPDNPQENQ